MNKLHNLRVLLVDDQNFILESITHSLTLLGVEPNNISRCKSANEAIKTINNINIPFDFILTDLEMKDGDGFDLITYLMKTNYQSSIAILSAIDPDIVGASYKIARNSVLNVLGAFQKPLTNVALEKLLIQWQSFKSPEPSTTANVSEVYVKKLFANTNVFQLENTPFCMFYQPQVHAKTGELKGVEALVRLYSSEYGIMTPALFLPVIDELGLTEQFDKLCIELCLEDIKTKPLVFTESLTVSINVSAQVFSLSSFVNYFIECSKGVDANRLIIEITENHNILHQHNLMINASKLRMHGYGLSIDDFGSKHSNLDRLSHIPFTELKIDRDYVLDILKNPKHSLLVKGVVNMAKMLNLNVVIEGVETEAIALELLKLGADELQGYYFSQPLSFNSLIRWIEYWNIEKHEYVNKIIPI